MLAKGLSEAGRQNGMRLLNSKAFPRAKFLTRPRTIEQITAIVVNYFSSRLTLRAVTSILASECAESARIVVVDNSECRAEAEFLRSSLPKSVHLLVPPRNLGFGQACNMAWEAQPGDALLLLNPDAYLLTGCLKSLVHVMEEDARVGAVGPQIYWDPQQRFLLPPSIPPSWIVMLSVAAHLGGRAKPLVHLAAQRWRRFAVRAWLSPKPFSVRNLSGGSVLLRADAIRDAGGLFDPRFFLYFEDTDLFARMKKKRWRLLVSPQAAVVHEFDRCGLEALQTKRQLMESAHKIFIEKHFPWYKHVLQYIPKGRPEIPDVEDWPYGAPAYKEPFSLPIPKEIGRPWLFEWSPNKNFIPAAGCFGSGEYAEFADDCFRRLSPGRYFGRISALKNSMKSKEIRFSFMVRENEAVEQWN